MKNKIKDYELLIFLRKVSNYKERKTYGRYLKYAHVFYKRTGKNITINVE